jgi:predicted transcriptional regulator
MKHEHVRTLPPERIEELDRALKRGEPAGAMADRVQNEWGLKKDVKRDTLVRAINRYRLDVVAGGEVARLVEDKTPTQIAVIANKIDVMQELVDLVVRQRERLVKLYTTEKPMQGVLLSQMNEAQRDMAVMLDKLARLQLETGIMPRAPRTLTGETVDEDGRVTRFRLDEDWGKLLEMARGDADTFRLQ